MGRFSMYDIFTAKPGQWDALVNILVEDEAFMQYMKDCELYLVNISDTEPIPYG